jgi:serine/threonine protein kinase
MAFAKTRPKVESTISHLSRRKAWIAKIAVGIAVGMRYLHSKDIVHYDLDPDAVFVDWDWPIKLGTLTHVRLRCEDLTADVVWLLESSRHLAPECHSKRLELASDVFSFGLILDGLIIGHSPFASDLKPLAVVKLMIVNETRPEIPEFVLPAV